MPTPQIIASSDEEFRLALETIHAIDPAVASVNQFKEQIGIILKGQVISIPVFDPGMRLHRARKMKSLPSTLAEIGAPPAIKVAADQRCNRAGESLFYCSSARNAPFFEVHAQVGEHLVLSEWRTTAKMKVNHIGYTRPTFERLGSTRSAPSWRPDKAPPLSSPRAQTIDELFSSFFIVDVNGGQEYLYKATIALAEILIPKPTAEGAFPFDGLIYPTIPMKGNCDNLALRPEFVERGVEFVKAEYLLIKQIDGMQMNFDILDFANSTCDGKLEWKGRPGHWVLQGQGQQLQFKAENGEWTARDSSGNIVPMS
jgi:hypothetical protein